MTDVLAKTLQKQFGTSPVIVALIEAMDAWVDFDQFQADFLKNIWDIETANTAGLDIWGRILGINRFLAKETSTDAAFGFNGTGFKPFGQAPFNNAVYNGDRPRALTDSDFRRVLLLKAAANIAKSTIPALNVLLKAAFSDRGKVRVQTFRNNPMQITYVFDFSPSYLDEALVAAGLFPVPAGVLLSVQYASASATFGFNGTGFQPFGQGSFNSNL